MQKKKAEMWPGDNTQWHRRRLEETIYLDIYNVSANDNSHRRHRWCFWFCCCCVCVCVCFNRIHSLCVVVGRTTVQSFSLLKSSSNLSSDEQRNEGRFRIEQFIKRQFIIVRPQMAAKCVYCCPVTHQTRYEGFLRSFRCRWVEEMYRTERGKNRDLWQFKSYPSKFFHQSSFSFHFKLRARYMWKIMAVRI